MPEQYDPLLVLRSNGKITSYRNAFVLSVDCWGSDMATRAVYIRVDRLSSNITKMRAQLEELQHVIDKKCAEFVIESINKAVADKVADRKREGHHESYPSPDI